MTTPDSDASAIAAASTKPSACCRRNRRRRWAVVDADGRLVGLVTSETIGEMMMVREALPERPSVRALGPAVRPEPDRGSSKHGPFASRQ